MSHEFRTPLNSILALSGLLLERADGELTSEQDKQVGFIRKGAETLLELVNDLLDLAKIEAGKVEVQPVDFEVSIFQRAPRHAASAPGDSERWPGFRRSRGDSLFIPMKASCRKSCAILFQMR